MSKKLSTALCLAVLVFSAATPIAATAAEEPATGATGTTTVTPADPSVSEAPLSMTPEEIAALQGETTAADSESDKSFFDKASDFVTDNAPFIIIGIIVLAAILAGIFIARGRNRTPKAPKGAKPAAGVPASVPSASEIRRRKRAAMQRSREEERLRRKAGPEGRQAVQSTTLPLSANLPLDPVQAEKQSARDQLQAAAAVARSGPVPAPASPTQNAPAPGVVQPGYPEPDTALTSPTPTPTELSAATAAAAASAPQAAAPAAPVEPIVAPEPVAPVPTSAPQDPPAQVYDLPSDMPEQPAEPAVEAPGLDATVGKAAAAFTVGAAGGALAGRAATSGADEQPAETSAESLVSEDPADDAARDAEQRLRAKVAEIKAEQGRGLAPAPVPAAPEAAPVKPEPVEPASMEDQLDEAEEIQREIESAEVIPPTPTGLAAVERKLQQSSDERDRTLREAESRLRRIEQRAEDAERRAAFAERLAQLKIDESERERRLSEVIAGIDRAEERAVEAEERAKAAEQTAASALEDLVTPAPPVPPAAPPAPVEPPAPPVAQSQASAETVDQTRIIPASRSPLFGGGSSGIRSGSGSLNLNSATFEELRDADLSVTQATRILAYRERFGGYRSVEDLEKVPGFPAELIESLRGKITV